MFSSFSTKKHQIQKTMFFIGLPEIFSMERDMYNIILGTSLFIEPQFFEKTSQKNFKSIYSPLKFLLLLKLKKFHVALFSARQL